VENTEGVFAFKNKKNNVMIKNYFKIAWRNLIKNKVYSSLNIVGLATGMAVALLIGLWVFDEINFNKSFDNYDRLGQLFQNRTFDGKTGTYADMANPMGNELRTNYPDFKAVALTSDNYEHVLKHKDTKISREGMFVEPAFTKMFSLKILRGVQNGVEDAHSVMLSETLAKTFFGSDDPIGKTLTIDNKADFAVSGVFQDFPKNSDFVEVTYLMPWAYYAQEDGVKENAESWGSNNYPCYVELNDKASWAQVQAKVKFIIHDKVTEGERVSKPELLIQPMSKWHLYSEFKEGVNIGGLIQMVWLFGCVGVFVLLLACINFMNLSTARSEKRAKEVGIRKAIGSLRGQLIGQFLSESFLMVVLAFILSLFLVGLSLPAFNQVADKALVVPISNPLFWLLGLGFCVFTGLLAGAYPAFYLSDFQPIKVLKGTFKAGQWATIPRKALIVVQFTVSVTLIIGTLIVYRQVQYAKDRPLGYDKNGVIYLFRNTPDLQKLDNAVLRSELLATNAVDNVSESSARITDGGSYWGGFNWAGLDPNANLIIKFIRCTHDFGKTMGFQFVEGRDFSRDFATDSTAVLVNQKTAALISDKNVVGKIITRYEKTFHIIGVVKDMVSESPYQDIRPAIFSLNYTNRDVINIKIKSDIGISTALGKIETVFKKLNPSSPFDYTFIDEDVNKKFAIEERIGKLASFFAFLAIFISCLGIFGLASFTAEQRKKEIGVRKVLGASVFNVWQLLSKEFIFLVALAFFIASPIAYYFLNNWLKDYEYRTTIPWWSFAISGIGALMITILTVSFQAIKAAVANPVKSLRTE
jgi:putative ABC transport system permease protein